MLKIPQGILYTFIFVYLIFDQYVMLYSYIYPNFSSYADMHMYVQNSTESNIVIKRWNIYNILQNKTTCTTRSHSLYYFIQYIFKKHTWKILQGIFDLYYIYCISKMCRTLYNLHKYFRHILLSYLYIKILSVCYAIYIIYNSKF